MKKIILLFTIVMAVVADGMAQNDAMYVYRNDGVINAFLKSDIDSMRYSCLDLDSVSHQEYVIQEVWTEDSIYRIPLEKIDSVGFVTPPTIYKEDATVIDESMLEYIIGADSLTLYFQKDTPKNILPKVQDKLIFMNISENLPHGFLGQVKEIQNGEDRISFVCSSLLLTDVFEQYYSFSAGTITKTEAKGSMAKTVIPIWGPKPFELDEPIHIAFPEITSSIKLDDNKGYAFKTTPKADIYLSPSYTGSAYLIVAPLYGVIFNLKIVERSTNTINMKLSGKIAKELETPFPEFPIFKLPLLDVYGKLGGFFRTEADLSLSYEATHHLGSTLNVEIASCNCIPNIKYNNLEFPVEEKSEFMISGSVSAGIFAELGLCFWFIPPSLMKGGVRAEAGLKLEGNAVLDKTDTENSFHSTNLYNTLLDTNIQLKAFASVGLQAKYFKRGLSYKIDPLSQDKTLYNICPVPKFTNTIFYREVDSPTTLFASAKAENITLPVDLGFTIFDGDSEEGVAEDGQTSYNAYGYIGPKTEIASTFFDMKSEGGYTLYPTVKLWDIEMLAEPKTELSVLQCPDNNHPHAIDLGLPSGTKWCCMNVGASSPEGYGGYYAWGETSEKSVYDWDTYAYYNTSTGCVNIGSDIAGTSYDAAHVNMGGSWVMPSTTQQEELRKNCSREWTQQNGVNGTLVTGPNGGKFFLPAAGYRWDYGLTSAGSYGGYWSSSLTPSYYSYYDDAYYLGFDSGGWDWHDIDYRYSGLSVRAVCP